MGGMSFEPRCEESPLCAGSHGDGTGNGPAGPWGNQIDGTMVCKCSGRDLPALEIVDRVAIPADLPAGEWVLGWRWDCEQSPQVWASCSDVSITKID